jgi:transmembrane 9 superfamily protein 1
MFAIFLFVHFPLTVVGAIVGRNITSEFKPPCRTNKVPREVDYMYNSTSLWLN